MSSWVYTSEAPAVCSAEPAGSGLGHNTRDGYVCEACGAVALELLRSQYERSVWREQSLDKKLNDAYITIRTLVGIKDGDA